MATLYKRATPPQALLLRIVEGAVKNAADAHPEFQISPQFRRSIAKRAVGTLTAQWPEVLARASQSASESGLSATGPAGSRTGRLSTVMAAGRWSQITKAIARRALQVTKRPPFRVLISRISRQIKPLKDEGEHVRAAALIDVLKLIHEIKLEAVLREGR